MNDQPATVDISEGQRDYSTLVSRSPSTFSLGASLDKTTSCNDHVNQVCEMAHLQIFVDFKIVGPDMPLHLLLMLMMPVDLTIVTLDRFRVS